MGSSEKGTFHLGRGKASKSLNWGRHYRPFPSFKFGGVPLGRVEERNGADEVPGPLEDEIL